MSQMTLTLDATAKPMGLVPIAAAVSRLAQVEQSRLTAISRGLDPETLTPFHCQVLHEDETRLFRSAGRFGEAKIEIPVPLVMMWPDYVPKKGLDWDETTEEERHRISRRVLFLRDGLRCSYCDFKVDSLAQACRTLTVDHVRPQKLFANKEEATSYANCVSACKACNSKKGDKLPMECHMYPRQVPKTPHYVQKRFAGRLSHPVQREYVRTYFKLNPEEVMF